MRIRLSLFLGIFSVMALSNAIVPVLTRYGETSTVQGLVYSAYFLGACACTLLAGILSDRWYGRIPIVRAGLVLTVVSGIVMAGQFSPAVLVMARLAEGAGAGFFISAALAYANSQPDHERLSGYMMALMNAGLVCGLVFSGWIGAFFPGIVSGILVFTILAGVPAILSFFLQSDNKPAPAAGLIPLWDLVFRFRWLWFSSMILIGITGVLTSLYPQFSDLPPHILGIWIAAMSISTVVAVLVLSRMSIPPVSAIRVSALIMAAGIMLAFLTPAGFLLVGALAGIVMIAQMAFLSSVGDRQGVAMGLFSTASYLGMAVLPFFTGLAADLLGFCWAFLIAALLAVSVALTIGRCPCSSAPVQSR